MDRAYALENGPSGFDPAAPKWLPKTQFLCWMRNARLAALDTLFDDASETLTIRRGGEILLKENLANENGRRAIEGFFETFMGDEKRGAHPPLAGVRPQLFGSVEKGRLAD